MIVFIYLFILILTNTIKWIHLISIINPCLLMSYYSSLFHRNIYYVTYFEAIYQMHTNLEQLCFSGRLTFQHCKISIFINQIKLYFNDFEQHDIVFFILILPNFKNSFLSIFFELNKLTMMYSGVVFYFSIVEHLECIFLCLLLKVLRHYFLK